MYENLFVSFYLTLISSTPILGCWHKLVFAKVVWRIENVPQLKFNICPGPKRVKENFKDFQGPKIQEFSRRARTLFILECKSFIGDRTNETTCVDGQIQ